MHLLQAVFTVFLVASPALCEVSEPAATPQYVPKCRGLHGPKNYPNPKQANTYFQCVYGRPVKLWCPSRQLFNAARGKCVPIKNIDEYPDVDRSKIKCRWHGQYICNPLNPRSFYQCSHGVPYLHDCPGGLVFNTWYNVCNYWAPINGCGSTKCPDGEEYNPDTMMCEQAEIDPCQAKQLPTGFYPDLSTDCEYYYRCENGSQDGDILKCPEGLRFDPRTMECESDLSIICAPCGTKNC
ncbi:protein obstructor-E-like [Liolophura sinensis]|uniref:protein obstructor-E-like n=1 Tax=Liolophura sinensis TaxID=3198878 RepID=UPI0031594FEB